MRDVIEIETPRLKLRKLRMSDAQCVARLAGDLDVARMVSRLPHPYFEVAAEGWIMTLKAREPLAREFVFAAELKGEGLAGVVGAHRGEGEDVEIGYWFGRPYWGQGLATEAARAFVAQARSLGRLHASHFVDNPASGRVLEKAGFVYTGETTPRFSLARGASAPVRLMRDGATLRAAPRAHAEWVH